MSSLKPGAAILGGKWSGGERGALRANLDSVLKIQNMCLLDMKLFSTSRTFRLSSGSMYFFSFSCRWGKQKVWIMSTLRLAHPSSLTTANVGLWDFSNLIWPNLHDRQPKIKKSTIKDPTRQNDNYCFYRGRDGGWNEWECGWQQGGGIGGGSRVGGRGEGEVRAEGLRGGGGGAEE